LIIIFYFFALAAAFLASGLLASGLGLSPITLLTGHTLKTGHFWQPIAMAMGHRVMANPSDMA
jgi:hypothetical protein